MNITLKNVSYFVDFDLVGDPLQVFIKVASIMNISHIDPAQRVTHTVM